MSAGDFQEGLAALLGKVAPNLSPAVITRLTAQWQTDYDAWHKRDLSARRFVYVWADGVYLQARMEEASECMLVLIGAVVIVAGLALILLGRVNIPLGRLPGDIVYRGKNTTFYFPLAAVFRTHGRQTCSPGISVIRSSGLE